MVLETDPKISMSEAVLALCGPPGTRYMPGNDLLSIAYIIRNAPKNFGMNLCLTLKLSSFFERGGALKNDQKGSPFWRRRKLVKMIKIFKIQILVEPFIIVVRSPDSQETFHTRAESILRVSTRSDNSNYHFSAFCDLGGRPPDLRGGSPSWRCRKSDHVFPHRPLFTFRMALILSGLVLYSSCIDSERLKTIRQILLSFFWILRFGGTGALSKGGGYSTEPNLRFGSSEAPRSFLVIGWCSYSRDMSYSGVLPILRVSARFDNSNSYFSGF